MITEPEAYNAYMSIMLLRNALAIFAVAFAGSAVANQDKLTVGSPAPALKVEGWVKGNPVPELKKGNVYVVEFWATWCGPCIAVFPHLSDLAEKYKDKVTVVSINTWDYGTPEKKEAKDAHKARVQKFIQDNNDKMRYNIALDDSNDTMAKNWMRASGQNGIPTAYIINENLEVAWIGHPARMDKPLEEIVNKTWDVAAFKKQFEAERKAEAEKEKLEAEVLAAAKANDVKKFDELTKNMLPMQKAAMAAEVNPGLAIKISEDNFATYKESDYGFWSSVLSFAAEMTEDKALLTRAEALSKKIVDKTPEKAKSVGNYHHAVILWNAGKKEEAKKALELAITQADKYEPANQREGLKKYLQEILQEWKS